MKEDRQSPFRDAHSDRDTAEHVPDTPQTRSPAYRLAFADEDFLCRDELRPGAVAAGAAETADVAG